MKNIEFNLVNENEKYKIYKNKYYEMGIEKDTSNIAVIKPIVKDMPSIYINYDIFTSKFKGIEIQTTSYGALSKEEVKEMNNNYNVAISTVEEIEENFFKE